MYVIPIGIAGPERDKILIGYFRMSYWNIPDLLWHLWDRIWKPVTVLDILRIKCAMWVCVARDLTWKTDVWQTYNSTRYTFTAFQIARNLSLLPFAPVSPLRWEAQGKKRTSDVSRESPTQKWWNYCSPILHVPYRSGCLKSRSIVRGSHDGLLFFSLITTTFRVFRVRTFLPLLSIMFPNVSVSGKCL